jgi:integrase
MLTVFAIEKTKPRDKPFLLTDGNGLHLLINPNGSKLWRFRYRFGGKQNLLSLGSFPEISLADAREKRDAARKLVAQGTDPSQHRKDEKRTATTAALNTFGAIAREYIETLEAKNFAPITIAKNRWLLLDLAKPLADKPITKVTPADILDILKRLEKSGKRETARRLRGAIGSVFRFAISTLRAETDPTYPLRGAVVPPIVTHRAAITDEKELGALWSSINEYTGWITVKACLKLALLTMARPGEVRFMRRSEIVFPKSVWQIPAARMKMRRPHDVPLSRQALEVLRGIWDFSQSDLVLPSIHSSLKPLSENAMNSALRRMGYGKEEVTSHGFRSSASTVLNERGYNRDVIEAALAHQDEDEVRAAYNRAKYWKERVALLQDWADILDGLATDAVRSVA